MPAPSLLGNQVTPAEVQTVTAGTGCRAIGQAPGGGWRIECPSVQAKVKLLDAGATHDVDADPRIRRFALALLAERCPRTVRGDYAPADIARVLLAYVQGLPFQPEAVETFEDTWTTLELGGDCDDLVRALLATARSVGLGARPTIYPPAHVTAELWDGTRYRWAETTIAGARLGEDPRAALRRTGAYERTDMAIDGLGKILDVPPRDFGPIDCKGRVRGPMPMDVEARPMLEDAWQRIAPDVPMTRGGLQYVQAVARAEGVYGTGWTKFQARCKGSNNWGAEHCPPSQQPPGFNTPIDVTPTELQSMTPDDIEAIKGPCGPGCCLGADTQPQSDGSAKVFARCFRTFPTPQGGADQMIRLICVARPVTAGRLETGDTLAISAAMYDEHYYQGFGKTRDARIMQHARGIYCHAKVIASELGEPLDLWLDTAPSPLQGLEPPGWLLATGGVIALGAGGYYLWKRYG